MSRKIRFALDMKDNVEVRTLDELRENFSMEKILLHIASGKLVTWLRDRYYDDIADKIEALDTSDSGYNKKICEIFDVAYDDALEADYEKAEAHNRKLKLLKAVSDRQEYIDNVDAMAFDQDDLYDLLDNGVNTIYLCGDFFEIPLNRAQMRYIGVNKPKISIGLSDPQLYYKNQISLIDVVFPSQLAVSAKDDERYKKAEEYFFNHDFKNAAPIVEELCNVNNGRAFVLSYYMHIDDSDAYEANEEEAYQNLSKGMELGDDLCRVLHALFVNYEEKKTDSFIDAKKRVKDLANDGDLLAAYVIGISYIIETDEPVNYEKAIIYLEKSAAGGLYRAYNGLGIRYENGQGVEKNLTTAFDYYNKASELNYGSALNNLAWSYFNGDGVEADNDMALKCFLKAAEQNNLNAISNLGWIYNSGKCGQSINYSEAIKWISKAAERGDTNSQNRFGVCYWEGNGVGKDIDRAIEWFERASEKGDKFASRNLGMIYYEGKDVPKDYERAKKYLNLATERGYEGVQKYIDIIEGNPTMLLDIIENFKKIPKNIYLYKSFYASFYNYNYGEKHYRRRSDAESGIYDIVNRRSNELNSFFSINEPEIRNLITNCQNEINSNFTQLSSAFVALSVDTTGLIERCEDIKNSVRTQVEYILCTIHNLRISKIMHEKSK